MDSIALALPHYGTVVPETIAAVMQATAGTRSLRAITNGASLLAHNFNLLWCNALNLRAEAKLTHFAMLHADIGVEPFWLDTLIDEMNRVGADVISAIVPIKDARGVTSTGWMDPETKNITRFTMREVMALPETFDADRARKPGQWLMLNTALWVCRFDQPWVEEVHFEIRDRISKTDTGEFRAVVLSEDWNFSAMCATKGLKLFATRKVGVSHYGRGIFDNKRAWGEWHKDLGDLPRQEKKDTDEYRDSSEAVQVNGNGHRPLAGRPPLHERLPAGEGLEAAGRPDPVLDALAGPHAVNGRTNGKAQGPRNDRPAHEEGQGNLPDAHHSGGVADERPGSRAMSDGARLAGVAEGQEVGLEAVK